MFRYNSWGIYKMSLKDELYKAKLINKKQVRQLEHEDRVEKKKLGKEGMKEKEEKRLHAIEEQQEEQKKRDQSLAKEQKQQMTEKERQARIEDIISNGKIAEGSAGNRKFYFVAKNGKIPFLFVTDRLVEDLQRGVAAIVEYGGSGLGEFVIVNAPSAQKIHALAPDMIRFYQG
jgi:uncharacterized protein YaiL (DUF2058 family)